jgi:hypothetical protein
MLVDRILKWAEAEAATRKPTNKIGAHNCGKCPRALWYMLHGEPGEAFQPRAIVNFALGDAVEDMTFRLIEKAAVGFVRTDDKKDTFDVPPVGRVRSDGVVAVPDDEPVLTLTDAGVVRFRPSDLGIAIGTVLPVEVKKMSDFAFARLERGVIDETYLAQGETYSRGYKTGWWLLFAVRGETGHLAEVLVKQSNRTWARIVTNCEDARGDQLPERPYEVSDACEGCEGRGTTLHKTPRPHQPCNGTGRDPQGAKLVWPCNYCPHKATCWADRGTIEMVIDNDKPKWFVKSPSVSSFQTPDPTASIKASVA